jgi:hypothetical protein
MIAYAEPIVSPAHDGDADPFRDAVAKRHREPEVQRCGVNVMVSQSGAAGAPLEYEALPSMANLTGQI